MNDMTTEQRERLDKAFAEFPKDAPPSVSQLRKAAGVGQNVTAAYLQAKRGEPIDMLEPDWDLDTFRPAISALWAEAAKVARARVDAQVDELVVRLSAAELAQADAEERVEAAEERDRAAEARLAEAEVEVARMQQEIVNVNERAARAQAPARVLSSARLRPARRPAGCQPARPGFRTPARVPPTRRKGGTNEVPSAPLASLGVANDGRHLGRPVRLSWR